MYLIAAVIIIIGLIAFTIWELLINRPRSLSHPVIDNPEDYQKLIDHSIMRHAKKELNVFHGDYHGDFFITPRISKAMKKADRTTLIFGPKLCMCMKKGEFKTIIELAKERHVELFRLSKIDPPSDNKYLHFVTADKKHVWLEKIHGPSGTGESVEYYNEPDLTEHYNDIFNMLKSKAIKIRPDHIVEDIGEDNIIDGFQNGGYKLASKEKLREIKSMTGELK